MNNPRNLWIAVAVLAVAVVYLYVGNCPQMTRACQRDQAGMQMTTKKACCQKDAASETGAMQTPAMGNQK